MVLLRLPSAFLAVAVLATACSTSQSTGSTLPDSAGAPDAALTETTTLDGAGETVAPADTAPPDTAPADSTAADAPADAAADTTIKADGATDGTTIPSDAAADASADLVADTAAEVAAADAALETTADGGAEIAADVVDAQPDAAPVDTQPDVAADAVAKVIDAATTDAATPVDAGAAACKAGELKRCWVECPQTYAAGCISGQIPILIMGTQACSAGQWGACDVKHQCGEFATGACQNGSKAPQNYLCTDGIPMTGAHICTKPLGANCTTSYYINWPIYDCLFICKGPDDVCTKDGAERECEVHCGNATGPVVKGKQKCQNVCNGLHWNMCSTGEACK